MGIYERLGETGFVFVGRDDAVYSGKEKEGMNRWVGDEIGQVIRTYIPISGRCSE